MHVYACADVMAKVRKLTRTKEEMAIELARGPDADAKCSLYLASATGKKRFDWEVLNQYGNLLHESLHRNAVLALFAGVFDAPPGQVRPLPSVRYSFSCSCALRCVINCAQLVGLSPLLTSLR
jgi:hypothetical protein